MKNFLLKKKTGKKVNKQKGFSLVELLVVALIFFILTGIVLFKQGKFSSDILITSTAYELALFVREAQVYGVGSRVQVGASNSRFAYGVNFTSASDREATLFADVPDGSGIFNYVYDSAVDGDVFINKIQFKREQLIYDFCGIDSSGVDVCKVADGLDSLNIGFVKPDLNAKVFGTIGGTLYEYTNGATLKVRSSLGDKCRTVRINPLGQISIDPVPASGTGCESS